MGGFVKLDSGILTSTLWVNRDQRDVFITALLMAEPYEIMEPMEQIQVDKLVTTGFVVPPGWYGFAHASGLGIIRMSGLDHEEGIEALRELGSPDPESRSSGFDGRRLIRVDGGYVILNYMKYRERDYTSAERSKRYRDRKLGKVAPACDDHDDTRDEHTVTRDDRDDTRDITQAEAEAEAEEEKKNMSPVGGPGSETKPRKPKSDDPLDTIPGSDQWFNKVWENYPKQQPDGNAAPHASKFRCKTLFVAVCKREKVTPAELAYSVMAYVSATAGARRYFASLETVLGTQKRIVNDFIQQGKADAIAFGATND